MLSHGVAFFVCFNENSKEDLDVFMIREGVKKNDFFRK